MNTSAFTQHFSFEFRSGIRNRTLLLLFYLFPLGFYFLASALMTSLNPTFREILIPAMVFFAMLTGALLAVPEPIIKAREAGIFRSYKIHGIPELPILLMPVLTTLMHMIVVALVIIVTAPLLFDAVLPTNWLGFVLAFLLMMLAAVGLGLLLGVVSPNAQAATLLGQAVFLPSMLIGGLMFPASYLPEALGVIGRVLPTTHAMNIYNTWALGLPSNLSPILSALVLLAGGLLALGLAIYLFNWDSQNKTHRGHPAQAFIALIPYIAAVFAPVTVNTTTGAGVFNGDLYIYAQNDTAVNLTQDGQDHFGQIAWRGDVLAYIRQHADGVQSLWVSLNEQPPFVLVSEVESMYPFSFTEDGLILFAKNTHAASDSIFVTEVYTIVPEAGAEPALVGQIDTTVAVMTGCGGGSPLPTDWQRWAEVGFGAKHTTLEMTPSGIVYSLDCVGGRTAIQPLGEGEPLELGEYFGSAALSPDRTQLVGVVADTTQTESEAGLAVADLTTGDVHLLETASEPDQVIWSSDGNTLYYTVRETLTESIPMTEAEQEALGGLFGVPDEPFAGFPLYAVAIRAYDLSTGEETLVYTASDEVSSIGRLFVLDENTLVFSQIPNLQGWIAAITAGDFDPNSTEDTTALQLATVPASVFELRLDTGEVREVGEGIGLFTPAS